MARYASFKYGDGTKYGPSTGENILWYFIVAWDGTYTGQNEAQRMIDLQTERGRDHFIKPDGRGFEHYKPGVAVAVFDNDDGRYDPYNTSGPLYPNVTPGKFVRIAVKDHSTNNAYSVFRGTIADIQSFRRGKRKFARIVVKEGTQWLEDRAVKIGLMQNFLMATGGGRIVTDAGWPSEWSTSSAQPGQYTIPYFWWWIRNAIQGVRQLQDLEMGQVFFTRSGSLVFRGANTGHNSDTLITGDMVLDDIVLPQPWEVVRNRADIWTHPKQLDPVNAILWELETTPALGSGATFTTDMIFRYDIYYPCGSGVQFDFEVNTQADGLGTDLTSQCEFAFEEDIGNGASVTIINRGASNGYVTLLTATGDAIYGVYDGIVSASDPTSEATYGTRTFTLDTPWMQDSNYAQAYADYIVSQFKDPKLFPQIQIEDRFDLQFDLDLWQYRIQLQLDSLGIDDYFRIGKVEHRWLRENGQAIRTTFKLEPYLELFGYP